VSQKVCAVGVLEDVFNAVGYVDRVVARREL
jgi:hypothetical protein